jgi:hypothetical protein
MPLRRHLLVEQVPLQRLGALGQRQQHPARCSPPQALLSPPSCTLAQRAHFAMRRFPLQRVPSPCWLRSLEYLPVWSPLRPNVMTFWGGPHSLHRPFCPPRYSVTFTKPKVGLKLLGTRRGLVVQGFTPDFDGAPGAPGAQVQVGCCRLMSLLFMEFVLLFSHQFLPPAHFKRKG